MTATIEPGPTPVLTLKDPTIRLQHYVAALLMWVRSRRFNRIVICENSGNGQALEGIARHIATLSSVEIEILTFKGNSGSWEFGKGFGEGVSLEFAFANSKILQKVDDVWKTTGRLYVRNSAEILELHEHDPVVMNPGDTRFYKLNRHFFWYVLQPTHQTINDHRGVSIEVAYNRATEAIRKNGSVVGLAEKPQYVGQDAGSGNWHDRIPQDVFEHAGELLAAQSV